MTLLELFSVPFMQRALIAAFLVGIAAPAVGTYIVQRRLALMGDGIGHVAVTGVAIGLWTQTSPTWAAVVVAIAGAVVIEIVRERGHAEGDVALAMLFYGGLAGGVFVTGLAGTGASRLQEFLFGSILTISVDDLLVTMALAVVLIVICVGLSPQLFAVSQDADYAKVAGLPVRFYSILVAVLAALSVVIAMRTVGLLLVSALMVVPVAIVQQLTRSFRMTLLGAMGAGLVASVGGLGLAAALSRTGANVQPGPSIVLVALAGFFLVWPIGAWLRRRRALVAPFPETAPVEKPVDEEHPHHHGEKCGHVAVEHGDHVDYIHDGHRHAAHVGAEGEHYDEH
ncbi:metal ABC transporter permease [Nocardioides sp. NPDC004968]|jgi:zinc transport system permease protein|uniref:metal ABC transporter permease n=1 Tax=unclassified Nocardioides TaxID=2615069 RepID=UPI00324D0630